MSPFTVDSTDITYTNENRMDSRKTFLCPSFPPAGAELEPHSEMRFQGHGSQQSPPCNCQVAHEYPERSDSYFYLNCAQSLVYNLNSVNDC